MAKDRRKLIHMHSKLADKQPTPNSLEVGEIAVNNCADSEFLSIKNSDDIVVRFSSDETLISWMQKKGVFPYQGQVTNVNETTNSSQLEIKLNQSVAALTPHNEDVNDQEGNDTAKFAIDMSKYAMIGANPSFSSVTVTNGISLGGNLSIDGDTTVGGALKVSGDTVLGNNATIEGGLGISGSTTTKEDVNIGGGITVSGNSNVSGSSTVEGGLTVNGDTVLGGTTTIDGEFHITDPSNLDLADPNDGYIYGRRNKQWERSLIQHGDGDSNVINGDLYVTGIGGYNGNNEGDANTLQETLTTMNEHIYNAHGSVSVSVSPSIIERDVETQITVRNTVQFLGASYTPQSVTVKEGSTGGTTVLTAANSSTTRSVSAATTYYATVTFIDGVQKSAQATVSAYYPKYFGGNTATTLNSSAVTSMTKQAIASSANGNASVYVAEGQYMWLCVPNGMRINRVTASGFDVPMESAATVAVDGKGNYLCYRSSSTFNAGTVSIVIS